MSFFVYTTIDDQGHNNRSGEYFSSHDEFFSEIEKRNLEILNYFEVPSPLLPIVDLVNPKLKAQEVVELCNYLSLYVGSGLEIQAALQDMADNAKRAVFRNVMIKIKNYLLSGYLISEAMRKTGVIPDMVCSLAKIGEDSGNLENTLKDAANYIERTEAIKSSTKRAMIYPGITLVAMIGGFIFWTAFVVPKIVELFYTMNVELPTATVILIHLSEFMASNWAIVFVAFLLLPVAITLARKNDEFRYYTDAGIWKMPVFGELIRGSQLAFYFQYLALMYSTGIPITKAFDTVTDSLNNAYFQHAVKDITESIKSGSSLLNSFIETGAFDPLVNRMMGIGEQTGSLDKQLTKISDIYFQRVQELVDGISKLIEPVIMIVVATGFAFFAIALLGPLYELMATMGT
ncbi:MAG: type II secretion system F family protein [Gammaproteobacteria bacterium]|nr:type II secretion system F family protein [Gammaproteobacteria bacterium]